MNVNLIFEGVRPVRTIFENRRGRQSKIPPKIANVIYEWPLGISYLSAVWSVPFSTLPLGWRSAVLRLHLLV